MIVFNSRVGKPSTKKKDATSDIADGISTLTKGGSGGTGGSTGGVVKVLLPTGANKKAAQALKKANCPSMDRRVCKTTEPNSALMFIDKSNMHVLHAKSVFNIDVMKTSISTLKVNQKHRSLLILLRVVSRSLLDS